MSKSRLWQRAKWVVVFLVSALVSGAGHAEPPPATASAEGRQFNGAPFPASVTAEGRQFNGAPSPDTASAKFVSIVLGAAGGLSEDNLTSYLLAPVGDTRFMALDAGTLLSGIRVAINRGSFADIQVPPESSLTLAGWRFAWNARMFGVSARNSAPPRIST